MDHTDPAGRPDAAHGQQHPIGLYLKIWGLLFVLSTLSYLVDYFNVQGLLRWVLIVVLMIAKAGLIVSIFMHMMWERLALVYAILVPPLCLLVLMVLMAAEAHHTFGMREMFFR
ncbi:cytochrome C oxidase subunit IV family protein [Burkholderia cepacia]|uniref:Cytochrome C oxidase subunit IV family protein n=1 Tax=Burkholderia cepacia TaxID=292 RepID=A0A8I1AME5_BURCE|nr:cytochrome C oxidase subunit IV family protein [Burkholderia cepacia]MBA9901897.1 cytochrome C oxidase subunit IV [Burkholderia cepacia]MBA9948819.1 cytochrome C oxidase subunit IV [Burkholderia cepacia]MBA9979081.1 cytochrome C oxidase subunit IV [Burkholderia cepacia]MBA9997792.1 cytochrome C oxidase subunit IV [Burkholderia cepacia]MBB0005834.1 cytochrome C oxidase subunit IV [Burkholderia cepacia]